jgi:hypothetical protein
MGSFRLGVVCSIVVKHFIIISDKIIWTYILFIFM